MRDKRQGFVYEIRGPDGSYVGSTINSPMRRWASHVALLEQGKHHCKAFQDLWNEHPMRSFSFHILQTDIEKDVLGERETYWAKRNSAFTSNATHKRQLRLFTIKCVIDDIQQGCAYRQIAKKYKISLGSITDIKNRYMR